MIRAAAIVSFKGAITCCTLYPLLWREGPEVLSVTVTVSLSKATCIVYSSPSLGKWAILYFLCIALITAFSEIDWQAGTLESCDLKDLPVTINLAFSGIRFSHLIEFTPWNKSSKVIALNLLSTIKILSAVLSHKLAFTTSSAVPENST